MGALALVAVMVIGFVALSYRPAPAGSGVVVLATFYPVGEFARAIGGDRVTVSLLVPMTVDVHDFVPTPSSVEAVASASVFVYNGVGLEPWVPSLVTAAENPHLVSVDSSIGVATLPVPAQFQTGNRTVDPHIWLDPVRAEHQVANILAGMIAADPADASYFTQNAQAYTTQLAALDAEARNVSDSPATREFVTFHESFAYFADRYDLTQVAIAGPFEEDPTPSDIQNVVDTIRSDHLCYVGYESLTNPSIAQAVATETNATLVPMDPIEGLSTSDQLSGATYLTKMQGDLASFSLVLNHVGCR